MPSLRLTKIGFLFSGFTLLIFTLALLTRSPGLLVLAGIMLAVFGVSLLLALANLWPVKMEPENTLQGPFWAVWLKRPKGSSYALCLSCEALKEWVPKLSGRKRIILRFEKRPKKTLFLSLSSTFPLGVFRVRKRLSSPPPVFKNPPSSNSDLVTDLAEYDGRQSWSRLDWKALARFQRLLVRRGAEEEVSFSRFPLRQARSPATVPPWAILSTYLTVILAGLPFLLKAPIWLALAFFLGLSYGLYRALTRKKALLPENLGALAVFLVAVFSLPGLSLANLWGRLAGFVLSVVLVKTLSPHSLRDLAHLFVLAFLLLLLQLIEIPFPHLWPFLVLLVVFLPALYFLELSSLRPTPRPLFPLLVLLSCATLVSWGLSRSSLSLLPRWSLSGLSAFLELGETPSLSLDPHPIGRLYLAPQGKVYLKAFVYADYHAGKWSLALLPLQCSGKEKEYLLELDETLPALPYWTCPQEIRTPWGPLKPRYLPLPSAIPGRYLFKGRSLALEKEASLFLGVPTPLKKKFEPWAQKLRGQTLSQTLKQLEAFFEKNFTYSLSPGRAKGDPVLWFFFEGRKGFCEYFASAAALLLRTMGFPARVVTGLVTEEYVKDHYLLRASSAHAWVEVWDGKDWLLFDPTPPQESLWSWKKWWPKLWGLRVSWWLALPLLLGLAGLFFWHRRERPDPAEEFLAFFQKLGEKKAPHETMAEFIARLRQRYPALSEELLNFLNLYHEVVFGEKAPEDRLRSSLQEIKTRVQRQIKGPRRRPS